MSIKTNAPIKAAFRKELPGKSIDASLKALKTAVDSGGLKLTRTQATVSGIQPNQVRKVRR